MYEESGRFHKVISELSKELSAEEVVEPIIQGVIDHMEDEEERDDNITRVAVLRQGLTVTGSDFHLYSRQNSCYIPLAPNWVKDHTRPLAELDQIIQVMKFMPWD